jgi:hypothetical protein
MTQKLANRGYICLMACEGLHRIIRTRAPDRALINSNEYRPGHRLLGVLFTSTLKETHEQFLFVFRAYAVLDDTHQDFWFDLPPDALAHLKDLMGEPVPTP